MRNKSGFTLIELIVAIGVLAIFSSFLFATVDPFEQFRKASDSQRKSDLAQIQRAVEAYYQDFGEYPASSVDYEIVYNSQTVEWGDSFAPYMAVLPKDTNPNKTYIYVADMSNGRQSYWLYASLDREGRDTAACSSDGSACPNVPADASCGSGFVCNYGLSSPNVSP